MHMPTTSNPANPARLQKFILKWLKVTGLERLVDYCAYFNLDLDSDVD